MWKYTENFLDFDWNTSKIFECFPSKLNINSLLYDYTLYRPYSYPYILRKYR